MSSASDQECSASTCRTWLSSCGLASFGTTIPAAAQSAAAATSPSNQGVPTGFTRISTVVGGFGSGLVRASMAATAMSLARSLSPGATASSRSATATSGAIRGIFAIMPAWLAGMNSRLRARVSGGIARSTPFRPRAVRIWAVRIWAALHHGGPDG